MSDTVGHILKRVCGCLILWVVMIVQVISMYIMTEELVNEIVVV